VAGVPQTFFWQKPVPEPPLDFREMREIYQYQRAGKDELTAHPLARAADDASRFRLFYIEPWSLPMALLPFALRDRRVAIAAVLLAVALAGSFCYPVFFPHYLAAYACLAWFLIVRGVMTLWRWRPRGVRAGAAAAVFVLLAGSMIGLETDLGPKLAAIAGHAPRNRRAELAQRLLRTGGRHVVFVRYGASHSFHDEWVYNAADVDAAPVVWCRWMGAADREVMRYYPNRQFWLADVDAAGATVARYRFDNAM